MAVEAVMAVSVATGSTAGVSVIQPSMDILRFLILETGNASEPDVLQHDPSNLARLSWKQHIFVWTDGCSNSGICACAGFPLFPVLLSVPVKWDFSLIRSLFCIRWRPASSEARYFSVPPSHSYPLSRSLKSGFFEHLLSALRLLNLRSRSSAASEARRLANKLKVWHEQQRRQI